MVSSALLRLVLQKYVQDEARRKLLPGGVRGGDGRAWRHGLSTVWKRTKSLAAPRRCVCRRAAQRQPRASAATPRCPKSRKPGAAAVRRRHRRRLRAARVSSMGTTAGCASRDCVREESGEDPAPPSAPITTTQSRSNARASEDLEKGNRPEQSLMNNKLAAYPKKFIFLQTGRTHNLMCLDT